MNSSHPYANVKIFISIAAYRDSEVPLTVQDLFAKADYPERVYVGVLNQLKLPEDQSYVIAPHPNVRQTVVEHDKSRGACWARHSVFSQLLGNEEFVMQIDSHMRFDAGWDTSLLTQWHQACDPMAVLTHYPMPYDSKTNVCDPQMFTQFNCQMFDPWGIPKVTSAAVPLFEAPTRPKYTVFLAAGCFFCKAEVVRQVPYDPHIYFNGEEFSYAVRLWTHGYNLYLPPRPFLYHDYGVDRGRRLHWTDNPEWQKTHANAMTRLRYLFGLVEYHESDALIEIERYGLGQHRTFGEWQMRHGIHLRHQLLSLSAKEGEFQ